MTSRAVSWCARDSWNFGIGASMLNYEGLTPAVLRGIVARVDCLCTFLPVSFNVSREGETLSIAMEMEVLS